jgi:hypothetical protein
MDKLMDAWIGSVHRTPLNGYYKRRYGRLLNQFDPLQLWTTNVSDESVAATLMNSDLGTILDLNLLYSFAPPGDVEPTRILEVGGGYGRLAEGAFNVFGDTIRYVLVDSVPGSLCYASEYLRRACPSVKVGSYYHGDAFDLEQFHCYVVPSWHFERLNNFSYDISVNIESFQEMSQTHVDHYLRLFNNVARQNGLIYVSNARDYVFKGHWNYPENWQNVLFTNTPRSWTDDHPTEVYIKRSGDFRKANDCLRVFYEQSGVPRRLRTSVQATRELMTQSTIRVAEGWVRGLRGLLPGTK